MILAQQLVVTAFQITPAVIEYGKTLAINTGTQVAAYAIGSAVGTNLWANMLVPVLTNPEFIKQQIIAAPTLSAKIAIIASSGSLFTAGGVLSLTADIATNAGIGSAIAAYLTFLKGSTMSFIVPTHRTDMAIMHTFVLTVAIGSTTLSIRIIIYLIRSYIRLCAHCYKIGYKITRGPEMLPEEYKKRLKKSQSPTFSYITESSTAPVRQKIVKSALFHKNKNS